MRITLSLTLVLSLVLVACGSGDEVTTDSTLPLDDITTTTGDPDRELVNDPASDAGSAETTSSTDAISSSEDSVPDLDAVDDGMSGVSDQGDADGAVVRVSSPAEAVAIDGSPLPVYDPNSPNAGVGVAAPAFSGPGLAGDTIEVSPGDGPLVVLFLAHWCPHCQAEVPELIEYFAQNPIPDGVEIVAVATSNDANRDNHPASDWLDREGWTIPTVVDDEATALAVSYGVSAFPFHVFIDANGVVAARVTGAQPVEDIGSAMQTLADGYLVPDSARPGAAIDVFRSQPTACGGVQPEPPVEMTFTEPGVADVSSAGLRLELAMSCGELSIELDPDAAPETVASMVFLAEEGYFDGTVCHRYVRGFVLQCGDPTATGSGGPGYALPDEFPTDGFTYGRGTVAMANAGPGSTGSQFFIATGEDTGLPAQFTVIGTVEVTDDFLDALNSVPLGMNDFGELSTPLETIYIESAIVTR